MLEADRPSEQVVAPIDHRLLRLLVCLDELVVMNVAMSQQTLVPNCRQGQRPALELSREKVNDVSSCPLL